MVGPAYMAGLGGHSDFDRWLLIPTRDYPRTGRFGGLPIIYDQITTNQPNPNAINMAQLRPSVTTPLLCTLLTRMRLLKNTRAL